MNPARIISNSEQSVNIEHPQHNATNQKRKSLKKNKKIIFLTIFDWNSTLE